MSPGDALPTHTSTDYGPPGGTNQGQRDSGDALDTSYSSYSSFALGRPPTASYGGQSMPGGATSNTEGIFSFLNDTKANTNHEHTGSYLESSSIAIQQHPAHFAAEAQQPSPTPQASGKPLQGEQHLVDTALGTPSKKAKKKLARAPKPLAVCINLSVQFMVAALALIMVLQFESFNHLLRVDCMNSPEIVEAKTMLQRNHEEATSNFRAEKRTLESQIELKEEIIEDLRKVSDPPAAQCAGELSLSAA
eukprot:scaffold2088_cov399-Prasinococcus_capsulatus_cf.AAC.14